MYCYIERAEAEGMDEKKGEETEDLQVREEVQQK